MPHVSIRARLIFLAVVLLAILTVSSTILTRELARDSEALADEAQLVSIVRSANSASKHFGDLKYWITDLAMTLLARSQQNAEAAKLELDTDLKEIAPVDPGDVAAIAGEVGTLERPGAQGGRSLFERRKRRRQRADGAGAGSHPQRRQGAREDRRSGGSAVCVPARCIDAQREGRGQDLDHRRPCRARARLRPHRADRALDQCAAASARGKHDRDHAGPARHASPAGQPR